MYATCLFCRAPLGRNETLEGFPVGRRLAYDAARGRLWVVCRGCERWNLTPLEARWEAIEEAERLYAGTRRRAATDEIGLARLPGGLELVRIGKPLRPEFAAWRYGDQFGRRRVRQVGLVGLGLAGIGALMAGGAAAGVGIGGFVWVAGSLAQRLVRGNPEEVVARLSHERPRPVLVTRRMLARTRIVEGPRRTFGLEVWSGDGRWTFEGEPARQALAQLIPAVNRFGGAAGVVRGAVARLDEAGGPEGYLARLPAIGGATRTRPGDAESRWWGKDTIPQTGLFALQPVDRLAIEMAAHEEQERRALDGELAALEQAWRAAEEIAAIADDLLLPDPIRRRVDER